MATTNWWQAVTLHPDIVDGRVDESLFAANLGRAVQGEGPPEYRDPVVFFEKTYLTKGLRDLLGSAMRRVRGDNGQNPVVILQTSFGGGKTHSELAVYHLLTSPDKAASVPLVASLMRDYGGESLPTCQVPVLPGTSLNPLGRTTREGIRIRTLWGEMAYRLGGPEAFQLVAETDATMVAPGEELLAQVLEKTAPAVILFDETLHYVDKVAQLQAGEGNLAGQTVAFLRELTDAVGAVPGTMMVVSLTASDVDQLSPRAMDWLARLNEHVIREAAQRTPIEHTEIHQVVRQRLFERVDEEAARRVARQYREAYASLDGLPAEKTGDAYERLMERSYPFHPELVAILYERWGAKPGFQLTRDTLRFLAFLLQELWHKRKADDPSMVQPIDVDLSESHLRTIVRQVSGEPQWETVIGTDVSAQSESEPAHAQAMDRARGDGMRLAEGLATTILMYSLGGGERPFATRDELRLACTREGVPEATWDDILARFSREFFYYYFDDAKYRFRKEPNVLSLQHTYRTNLKPPDVLARAHRIIEDKALGIGTVAIQEHRFAVSFRPASSDSIPDDEELKLVVLGLEHSVEDGELPQSTSDFCLDILDNHGQVHRQKRNTIVFCVADGQKARLAQSHVADYVAWRKVQENEDDWQRIGGAQQALVNDLLPDLQGAATKSLIEAYAWALVPTQDAKTRRAALRSVRLGAYGPGKLVVPMVWERLTTDGGGQHILKNLTPETFLDRYGSQAWPKTEQSVTTAELWDRFTELVGLPLLASREVLLDMLALGQREGFFALGHLADADSPRDQRDSYLSLYYKDQAPPAQVPIVGERWLVMWPSLYTELVGQPTQVSVADLEQAINELNGTEQPVRVEAIYNYVRKGKDVTVDKESFYRSLAQVVHDGTAVYHVSLDAPEVRALPESAAETLTGWVAKPKATPPPPVEGRTVTVSGTLAALDQLAPLFKGVLRPLASQNPSEFSIAITVTARYEKDPGAGLTALLADGFSEETFPGLTMTDSGK